MLRMCALTVFGETDSCPAISGRDKLVGRCQFSGLDRGRKLVGGLLPLGPRVITVRSQVRHVPVLGEGLAHTREVAAPHQAGVEGVQQGSAYLPHLHGPDCRGDGPADVPEVALPGGQISTGDRKVLVEQLGHGDIGFGRTAFGRFLQQPAEIEVRLLLGPDGGLEANCAAGERVGPGVHLHAPGSAGESLYVSGRSPSHDVTVPITDIGPRSGPRIGRDL